MNPPNLQLIVGLAEIADLCGITRPAVSNWRYRFTDDWPAPRKTLKCGPLYFWPDVQAFLKRHPGLVAPRYVDPRFKELSA